MDGILLRRNLAGAASATLLEMIVETQPVFPPGNRPLFEKMATRAQRKDVADKLKHGACRLHVAIRAVVFPGLGLLARHEDARKKLLRNHNPGIRLIVFQQHVVARLVFLDHGVLEMKGILLGAYNDETHVDDIAHKQICARRVVAAVEVRAHPPLETFGLAYIYHLAVAVDIHVDTRRVGKTEYLLAQMLSWPVVENIVPGSVGDYLYVETSDFIDKTSGVGYTVLDSSWGCGIPFLRWNRDFLSVVVCHRSIHACRCFRLIY